MESNEHFGSPHDSLPPGHQPSPIIPEVVQPVAGRPRRRLIGILGWIGLLICFLIIGVQTLLLVAHGIFLGGYDSGDGIQENPVSFPTLKAQFGSDKVAIISVSGVIMEGDGFVKRQIDWVRADKKVKAIVLRVNSPGGTVTGSDFIYHHLKRLREEKEIPIVVSMGSVAASGGYYVAMAVGDRKDSIYAEPTTTTGSIGVIIPHYDITGLMKEWGVKDDSFASHPRKQMLSMTREISPDERKVLEAYLGETFARFKEIVQAGRPALRDDEARLRELATGEIFTATQAARAGLVDRIGFIEDAIGRAIELAGLKEDDVQVVRYERPTSLFDFAGVSQAHTMKLDLATLFDLTTPHAYYLTTTLPLLLSTYSR